jgi:ribonucleoside-diphosphate reductase alpha chain
MTIGTTGNFTKNAVSVLERRYLLRDGEGQESPEEMFSRVSKCLSEVERNYRLSDNKILELEKSFFELMWSLDFIPNSPTLMNAGTGQGTLSACYVLDIDDSMDSITATLRDQAFIEKFGGGVGFALSGIRPKGKSIATTQGFACGPIAVLRVLSEMGNLITQGGKRAGAHMAIMSVYHPDILEFIECKTTEGHMANFNISVGADSNFMEAVERDQYINLSWPLDENRYYEKQLDADGNKLGNSIKARDLFNKIVVGAWKNGEPGMVWLDRINEDNTTPQIGRINATNPCGEQPLLSGESCNLGSINLGNFCLEDDRGSYGFDSGRFEETVKLCVRLLDNVVDANKHPTDKTNEMNKLTRKIGLGVMGWADLLTKLGIQYDSEEALELGNLVASNLKDAADEESSRLGKLKGNFPAFDESTLNKKNGGEWEHMRNAWRLSIAPTGTISMIADASSGIEPHFALSYKKHNMSSQLENTELYYINKDMVDHIPEELDINEYLDSGKSLIDLVPNDRKGHFRTAHDISPEWHVRMQSVWQNHIDSGISKTINMPFEASKEDVVKAYKLAWSSGCKGITVYRNGSRQKEVLVSTDSNTGGSNTGEPSAGGLLPVQVAVNFDRPEVLEGQTWKVPTGHGNMYVSLRLIELFANVGKSGASTNAQIEALGRVISTALQHGVPAPDIAKQLRGINSDKPVYHKGRLIRSAPDAIAWVLDQVSDKTPSSTDLQHSFQESVEPIFLPEVSNRCPDCDSEPMVMEEGCMKCYSCGYSACN